MLDACWRWAASLPRLDGNHHCCRSGQNARNTRCLLRCAQSRHAPQRHGHRLYKQSIATFDADYARSLGIDVADARNYGVDYNPNWGLSPFSSYQEYYNGSVHDARDSEIIMERENFYHKPQANLNWYWTPNAQFMLSNVFYFSRGKGGGTGRLGANPSTLPDGSINWQRVADELNTQADSALVATGAVSANEIAAATIIRNSVNQHFWYGYLGTAEYHLSDIYKLTFGTDLRYYKGEHWREVRNLLDERYVSDADDGNDQDAASAYVFLGLGRHWHLSLSYDY